MTTRLPKRERLCLKLAGGWNELAVRDAILETKLSQTEKLLLAGLVSHADEHHVAGELDRGLSVRRIAELATCHKDSVGKVLARLEPIGLVRVLRDPRERHADRFDLSELPAALVRLLSRPEGQSTVHREGTTLSRPEGQTETETRDLTVPPGRAAVPPEQGSLSLVEGPKGSLKGSEKEQSRRSAPSSGAESEVQDGEREEPEADPWGLAPPLPPAKRAARRRPTGAKTEKGRKTSAPKAEKKRTPEEHAAHERVVATHLAIVLEATGTEPTEEHAAAWKLLGAVKGNADEAERRIREAVHREFGGTTSLMKIASKANDYIPRPGTSGRAREARDHDQVSTVLAAAKRHPLGQAATT